MLTYGHHVSNIILVVDLPYSIILLMLVGSNKTVLFPSGGITKGCSVKFLQQFVIYIVSKIEHFKTSCLVGIIQKDLIHLNFETCMHASNNYYLGVGNML